MWDLVGNPEDRFSQNEAQLLYNQDKNPAVINRRMTKRTNGKPSEQLIPKKWPPSHQNRNVLNNIWIQKRRDSTNNDINYRQHREGKQVPPWGDSSFQRNAHQNSVKIEIKTAQEFLLILVTLLIDSAQIF